ncbi:MAG: carbohydrate porin [Gemmatimonadetes bacterium]|nr:carbohydrate porin [Gemmatimonadota bacterium]NIR79778.1 carbohydrate porin [Gemmatimonadota bacterium]NIT88474.1 carbohydrate porin [Gemmatimonadota bacterium]NIU32297.1 carbohydrate porin [Gemmatimonadota bacterium]NIU36834.1 carbohydrate porin [Gemmatimonadota bacterium]
MTRTHTAPLPVLVGAALAGHLPAVMPASVGAQEGLAAAVEADAAYTADLVVNARGGVERGVAGLGNLDLTARVDLDELTGWGGTTMFVYVLANHGENPSAHVGDVQTLSNIEAPSAIRLYEAWVEKDLRSARLSLLLGLYDLNSEFDVLESAAVFVNSSFGIGAEFAASCLNGPSIFPVTSLALRAKWRPTPSIYVQGAVLDGVPGDPSRPGETAIRLSARDGALLAGEVGWILRRDGGEDEGGPRHRTHGPVGRRASPDGTRAKVAVGIWDYTRSSPGLDPDAGGRRVESRPGAYLLGEWKAIDGAKDPSRGLTLSARVGVADPRTNRFVSYTGATAVYRGLLPGRPADETGIGVAAAHNGNPFLEARRAEGRPAARSETALELTYRVQGERWALQPDLQWVLKPGTDPTLDPALAAGVRAELRFF